MVPDKIRLKVTAVIENFVKGLAPLKSTGDWIKAVLWSALLWYISLWQVYFIEMAVGIRLPFIATFIIQSVAALAVMVPFAPGYIGVFHQRQPILVYLRLCCNHSILLCLLDQELPEPQVHIAEYHLAC